ncbi:MAG: hypothetical protein ABI856_19830 [Nitrospira sp.]
MTSPNSPTVRVEQVEGQPSSEDLPASTPTTQEEVTTPANSTQVQERAVRQGVAGGSGNCTCMRPAGQCVFSALGGCVSHRGNPCNGGCIMQQSTPGIGGMTPSSKGGSTYGPVGPGSVAK